jgi:hypothetical protein
MDRSARRARGHSSVAPTNAPAVIRAQARSPYQRGVIDPADGVKASHASPAARNAEDSRPDRNARSSTASGTDTRRNGLTGESSATASRRAATRASAHRPREDSTILSEAQW